MASSRFVWSLARDSALPFSSIVRRISTKERLPLVATVFVVAAAMPGLLLLAAHRDVVANLILQTCGFVTFFGYATPVAIYVCGDRSVLGADGRRQWSLRKFSVPAGWISIFFVAIVLVVMSFPTAFPVTASEHRLLQKGSAAHSLISVYFCPSRIFRLVATLCDFHLFRHMYYLDILWERSAGLPSP
jgi:amino acid transporter